MAAATAEGVEILGGASVVGGAGETGGSTVAAAGTGREEEDAFVEEARVEAGRAVAAPARIGVETLVESWMMSLPCTTS